MTPSRTTITAPVCKCMPVSRTDVRGIDARDSIEVWRVETLTCVKHGEADSDVCGI
jgi:hypothetical protein